MIRTPRSKRLVAAAAASIALLVVVWLFLPFWMLPLLRPIGGKFGARFESYRPLGLTHFQVTGFTLTNAAVRIRADRITGLAPNAWLWRLATKQTPVLEPFLRIEHWNVQLRTSTNRIHRATSTYTNALQVNSVFRELRHWIPLAVLSDGTIQGNGFSVAAGNAVWSNGVLRTQAELAALMTNKVSLAANFTVLPRISLQAELPSLSASLNAALSTNQTGLALSASGNWLSNRFGLDAQFARRGVLPETANLELKNFELPAAMLHLQGYEQVSGSVALKWQQPQFALEAAAKAWPPAGSSSLPLAELTLRAHGNTNSATIETALLSSPWVTAELSSNLTVHFTGKLLREPAFLRVNAALTNQPWLPLEGALNGNAELTPGQAFYPHIAFRLSGSGVGLPKLKTRSLSLNGSLEWPLLHMVEASAELVNNAMLSGNGDLNIAEEDVKDAQVSFKGSPPAGWLPSGWSVSNVWVTAALEGPLKALAHRGVLDAANMLIPGYRPLQAHAQWFGTAVRSGTLETSVRGEGSELLVSGTVEQTNSLLQARVNTLALQTNSRTLLELSQPFVLTLGKHGTNPVVTLGPLDWSGPAGRLSVELAASWPKQGHLRTSARDLDSAVLRPFLQNTLSALIVHKLDCSAGWTNSPLVGEVDASASVAVNTGQNTNTHASNLPVSLNLQLAATDHGLVISNLLASVRNSPTVDVHGTVPISLRPAAPQPVELSKTEPLQLTAIARPEALFWSELAQSTGLQLLDPRLQLQLSGSWAEPLGRLHFTAVQVHVPATATRLPTLSSLLVDMKVDRAQAVLTNLQVLVQGIPLLMTAQVPLGAQFWDALMKKQKPALALEQASAHLQVDHGDLSLMSELFPKMMTPQGELNVDLNLKPGARLEGEFSLTGLRSRPIPGLGPVRNITEQTRFQGETATATASASIGGAGVSLAGSALLAGHQWLHGEMPPLQFSLRGTNVPLSRSPNSIIRSDLDLSILKTNGAPPLISGAARLRDSYFLSDLRLLVPGKVSAPSRRPPYFSIEEPVLADWRLAVTVTGERFLRVRTPVFTGEVSANLQVHGTLKNPIATGDARINSGVIRFPFSSLEVQQGFVTLSPQDPFRPQLSVTATSKQFGYDVKMEASGRADLPVIQFSSTPPLSSEQVLLMVTAGQAPREQQVYSTQQRAETVGVFLGRDLLTQLGLTDTAQERLTVRSGEQITETGRPTYDIEYKLTPNWSLLGEYDRFNQFNVDVKWRIYSK